MTTRKHHLETCVVTSAATPQSPRTPVVAPIVQSVNFSSPDVETWAETVGGDHDYTRLGNPTVAGVESTVAALESGAGALVFGSGMAAITSTLMALLKQGEHVLAHRQLFYGSYAFMHDWLPRSGIDRSFVDCGEIEALDAAIRPTTRVLYVESPTNPLLEVLDLPALARFSRERGLTTIVDNTLATPFNQRPLECGIDVVVHSATKYLAGHSDVVCGAVIAQSPALLAQVRAARTHFGGVIDPHAAWLFQRGLKTLAVRMAKHNQNGVQLARFLASHPRVARVFYPLRDGAASAPLAANQMAGGGGIVSFVPTGGRAAAARVLDRLQLARRAGSLGSVETLAVAPGIVQGRELPADARQALGLREDLIRVSVGIEHIDDLIADFDLALS